MSRIWKAFNHAGMALLVFAAIVGVFLWRTGNLRVGPGAAPAASHSADDGHGHAAEGGKEETAEEPKGDGAHSADDGHGHAAAKADAHGADDGHGHAAEMCAEHGLPESACVRCNPALIPVFKAKGDWCAEHNLPESLCTGCRPARPKTKEKTQGAPDASLRALEQKQCEHGKLQVDCTSCRFELGVVKVQPSLAKSLLTTAKVERREVAVEILLTGEVQLDPTRVVDVAPPAAGRVVQVLARLGQTVKEGDTLAVIHSGDFGEAKAKYLEAATQVEIARKEQERQSGMTAAMEKLLDKIAKNDGSAQDASGAHDAGGKPKEFVGEGRSKLVGATARLKLAKSTYEREKDLCEKQVSSKADYETARHEFEAAQADYAALVEEAHLNLSLNKLRADNAARKAEADFSAATERLHLFGLDHAAMDALRQQKENGNFARLEVKAPRSGTITVQNAAQGRFVDATQTLYTIADLSSLWVWCDLYERDLAAIHARLAKGKLLDAVVRVAAFGETGFPGTLDFVGSSVDEHTRTLKARVQVPNPHGQLRPGMFANVEVKIPSNGPAALVPRDAILNDSGKAFVFQHWKDDFWVRRDVTLGLSHGDFIELAAGVPDGALVAVNGAFMLKGDILRGKMGAG